MAGLTKILTQSIFPYFCLNCGIFLEKSYLCEDCLSNIEVLMGVFCPFCSKRIPMPEAKNEHGFWEIPDRKMACPEHKNKISLWGIGIATIYKNPILRKALFALKYRGVKGLSLDLSKILKLYLFAIKISFKNFVLIPMPISRKKLRRRGFNQALLLAKELNKDLRLELSEDVLIKSKDTKSQVETKNLSERILNVSGSFTAKNCKDLNILLLDDVYTTGATLEESAKALKEAGAKKVFGLVLAKD